MALAKSFSTPRSLDPTFAQGGVLSLPLTGIAGDEAAAVLGLPDKKLLVAIPVTGADAPVAIAKLNEDGSLDATFGTAGKGFVEIVLDSARISYVSGLEALEGGDWLLHFQYYSRTSNDIGLALVRLKNTGEPDKSFGTGGVRFISYYGVPQPASTPREVNHLSAGSPQAAHVSSQSATVQADGKILFLHSVFEDNSPLTKPYVIRLLADGSLDQSFNRTGYVEVNIGATSNTADGIAVQADGKVLLCGSYRDGSGGNGVFLARLDASGALDSQFNNGLAVLIPDDEGESLLQSVSVRESDGRIIVAGLALRNDVRGGLIAAFTASGAANLVFNGGKPLFSPLVKGLTWAQCSQLGGSIVVVGQGETVAVTARFLADGKPDTAFNGTGHALFEDSAGDASARGLAVLDDGRIVVCIGLSSLVDPSKVKGRIVRYLAGSATRNNDPTFGDGGILRFPLPGFTGYDVRALLVLPQNKLLVAVRLSTDGAPTRIVRLLENGALDSGFGGQNSGYVEIRLKDDSFMSRILGFTPLGDGGWLVVAQYTVEGDRYASGLVLVRQREDGQLETSFAEQGVLYLAYDEMGGGGHTGLVEESPSAAAATGAAGAVAQQADEKIVVVSTVEDAAGRAKGIVLRFDSNGSPDTTFNGAGFAFVELAGISPADTVGQSVAVQTDGGVVVCGNYFAASANGAYVTRFNTSGQVDAGFGKNGVVDIPRDQWISLDVAAIVGDKIVVAGGAQEQGVNRGLVAVLNFSGEYNLVFNAGQPLLWSPVTQGVRWLHCLPQADGSIIVCGSSGSGALDDELSAVTARILADGSPDTSFFGTGFSVFNESEGFEYPHGMAVMDDGRIVVGGVFFTDAGYEKGWVIRYLHKSADMTQAQNVVIPGTPDPSFAQSGILKLPLQDIASTEVAAIVALPDKKLLVALPSEENDASLAIARLNEDGTLDKSFGQNKGFVELSLVDTRMISVLGLDALRDGGWLVRVQYFSSTNDDVGQALVRLKTSGELDDSFGNHGVRLFSYYNSPDFPLASPVEARMSQKSFDAAGFSTGSFVEQADGKIVLRHFLFLDEHGITTVVMRLLANGALDPSLGGTGYVDVNIEVAESSSDAIAVQPDGKVLVCGTYRVDSENSGVFIARLDVAGQLDKEFNIGQAKLIFNDDGESRLNAISVREGDGRIVAVGDARRKDVHGGLMVVLTASGAFNLVFNNGQPLFSPLLPGGLTWWHTSQLDGSIIVVGAGDSAVMTARFLADGRLDAAFNGRGYTLFNDVVGPVFPRGLAIMEDGRIVVGITHTSLSDPSRIEGWITRYLGVNAALGTADFDPAFGDGGIVILPLAGFSEFDVRALLALPDNKLLVAVRRRPDDLRMLVARLLEDGQLDLDFGDEQKGFIEILLKDELFMHSMHELTLLAGGGFLIRAEYQRHGPGVSAGLVIVKLHEDGRLDQTFAEQGVRYLPYAQMGGPEHIGLPVELVARTLGEPFASQASQPQAWGRTGDAVLQQDQKIIVVSSVRDDTGRASGIVIRLNPDGSDDTTFNGKGFALVNLAGIPHESNYAKLFALHPDGAVVVGGSYNAPSPVAYLVRFDVHGQIDNTFGEQGNGVVTLPHEDLITLSAISIVDSKIVIAGSAIREGALHGLIAVLTSKGSYNLVFNNGKPLFSDFVPHGLEWRRCAARVDGSIIVSGYTGLGVIDDDLSVITARFLADGSPDHSFSSTGFSVFDKDGVYEEFRDMTVLADGRIVVAGYFIGSFPNPEGWILRYLG